MIPPERHTPTPADRFDAYVREIEAREPPRPQRQAPGPVALWLRRTLVLAVSLALWAIILAGLSRQVLGLAVDSEARSRRHHANLSVARRVCPRRKRQQGSEFMRTTSNGRRRLAHSCPLSTAWAQGAPAVTAPAATSPAARRRALRPADTAKRALPLAPPSRHSRREAPVRWVQLAARQVERQAREEPALVGLWGAKRPLQLLTSGAPRVSGALFVCWRMGASLRHRDRQLADLRRVARVRISNFVLQSRFSSTPARAGTTAPAPQRALQASIAAISGPERSRSICPISARGLSSRRISRW